MKNAVATSATSATTIKSEQQQDEPRTPKSSSTTTASPGAPGAPVKAKKTATPPPRRKYLLESEEELPAAKRRKLNPEFEAATTAPEPAQQQQRLSMSDICYALDEIADRMEQHGQCEQQYSHSVAESIATIRQNQSDIALLMGYVQDTHTGIQKAHERIEAELAKLETMTVVPATATATDTKPKFDASNYQCHECSQTFDPSIRGYWLIGAPCRNPNTTHPQQHEDDEDDMFYLCRECTRFENEHNDKDNHGDMAFGVMEDGEYDYDQYEDQYERARREHYDHSEECS
jgi:protein-arginine kinase activator protein McsA